VVRSIASTSPASFTLHAGPRAIDHIRRRGLSPADVRCVPAAAGGPKGLGLLPLDARLFGRDGWLHAAPDLTLVGASIGAWRLFCAAQRDADAAMARLREGYLSQRFTRKPTPRQVSDQSRLLARTLLVEGRLPPLRDGVSLAVITARARGALSGRHGPAAFMHSAARNLAGRRHLAANMARVVFSSDSDSDSGPRHDGGRDDLQRAARAFPPACDAFGCTRVALTDANAEDALLASGSIPLIFTPVRDPAGAPPGDYWDGGLIDYHLLLPYQQFDGLVLYPHFVPFITPGWLDKYLPWRRHARAHRWLDNLVLISPSPALLARLPNGKLPDRNDFTRYGERQDERERDWRRAVAECERLADEVMAWLERPDPARLQPI
jgi:hypothetical protein